MTRPLQCILFSLLMLQSVQPASAQRKYDKTGDAPLNVDMIAVKGGSFDLGSDDEASDRKPAHNVALKDFSIGKYEVTQEQWTLVMGDNPSLFLCKDCPVNKVSYTDVQAFIAKLNTMTGKHYRLPTEAEWEYAARGGNHERLVKTRTSVARGGVNDLFASEEGLRRPDKEVDGKRYSGKKLAQEVAWYERNSRDRVHPIGRKRSNALGIHDMSGNVEEWCSDFYAISYGSKNAVENPQGPSSGNSHVVRGGAYNSSEAEVVVTRRAGYLPATKASSLGFRLAMDK